MVLRHVSMSTVIWGLVTAYFANSFYTLYKLWNPPACSPSSGATCVSPLFGPDQKVDIYVYASTSKKPVTWLSPKKFDALIPLWNATGRPIVDVDADINVSVPLPPSVRRNGSLYAHVIMVRSGMSPYAGNHSKLYHNPQDDVSQTWYHFYPDLVYAQGTITRHLVPVARNRSMLLGADSNDNKASNDNKDNSTTTNDTAPPIAPAHESESNTTRTADPGGSSETAAQWLVNTATGFGLSAMAPANAMTAAGRYALVAVGMANVPDFVTSVLDAFGSDKGSLDDVIKLSSGPPVTHWKRRLDITLVQDFELYSMGSNGNMPGIFIEFSKHHKHLLNRFYKAFVPPESDDEDGEERQIQYAPWLEVDEFSLVTKYLQPLSTDESRPDPQLDIRITGVSRLRHQVKKQMEGSSNLLQQLGFSEYDLDDVKQLVSETSLKMLGLTYVISMLHMVFDYLAFKNDVGFFQSRKDYTGISGRTLLSSFVSSVIISLYLLDNEYTSRIVLGSVVIGTVIEGWKVFKVLRPTVYWMYGLPWMRAATAEGRSAGENSTAAIDELGFAWLSYALYPLVLAWAIYSLFTEAHKSWWSWAIHALANGVYTFGFIMMTPQLFINYKLKSVAHLPWKVFMYKAFNTFIDDVFSFIMVMPTSHRIACLRDDVVFFVYLYQRWLYPVDMKRANEFGMAYEKDEDEGEATGDCVMHDKKTKDTTETDTAATATQSSSITDMPSQSAASHVKGVGAGPAPGLKQRHGKTA
eukprot:m.189607 g.189607  ORF g.189607 m.189607 type:complete len:752 (-) comp17772_c0_seq1:108-2363(-)